MTNLYNVELVDGILKIGFGDPAENNAIVPEAVAKVKALANQFMGKVLRISGPASMPVAMAFGHEVGHLVPAVACFDPKLAGYVVCISHDPNYKLGDIIQ
jgi:CRISPR-associated protein Csx3